MHRHGCLDKSVSELSMAACSNVLDISWAFLNDMFQLLSDILSVPGYEETPYPILFADRVC